MKHDNSSIGYMLLAKSSNRWSLRLMPLCLWLPILVPTTIGALVAWWHLHHRAIGVGLLAATIVLLLLSGVQSMIWTKFHGSVSVAAENDRLVVRRDTRELGSWPRSEIYQVSVSGEFSVWSMLVDSWLFWPDVLPEVLIVDRDRNVFRRKILLRTKREIEQANRDIEEWFRRR